MKRNIELQDGERSVDMTVDAAVAVLTELSKVQRQLSELKAREEQLKKWLKATFEATGSTVAEVAGVYVATNRPTSRFSEAAFRKGHRDLIEAYTVREVVERIDVDRLRAEQPGIHSRYLSRSLLIDDEAIRLAAERAARMADPVAA